MTYEITYATTTSVITTICGNEFARALVADPTIAILALSVRGV